MLAAGLLAKAGSCGLLESKPVDEKMSLPCLPSSLGNSAHRMKIIKKKKKDLTLQSQFSACFNLAKYVTLRLLIGTLGCKFLVFQIFRFKNDL